MPQRIAFRLPILIVPVLIVVATGPTFSQPAAKPTEFEVISIKPADPNARDSSFRLIAGEAVTARNWPLREVIRAAYGLQDFQLSGGPGWVATERFDIEAKPPSASDGEATSHIGNATSLEGRLRERLRSLLASRCGLVVHQETREQTVYFLTVAKNGPKLRAAEATERSGTTGGSGESRGTAATIPMLVFKLSNVTGRAVLDHTGLIGKYDWSLEWTPEGSSQADPAGPTIFTALQEQLGLKLESAKGPVDTIAIDHINRPSPN